MKKSPVTYINNTVLHRHTCRANSKQMAQIQTNATMPPRRLCVVRDNWISRPSSLSMVVGNMDSQLESKWVGCHYMDMQFDLLRENIDERCSPLPSCTLDACSFTETSNYDRFFIHADCEDISKARNLQSSDVHSICCQHVSISQNGSGTQHR